MNPEAHQDAIPACPTTWKRTRHLTEGAHPIGRRTDAFSAALSESASGLEAILRPDDALDGVLDDDEVGSCAIVDG